MKKICVKLVFILVISSYLFGITGKNTVYNRDSEQFPAISSGERFVAADFDNDGDIDIFVIYKDKENTLWLNEGNFHFKKSSSRFGTSESNGIAAGDIDGNGTLDLYIANNNRNHIWLNDGWGKFSLKEHYLGGRISTGILLSDLDNNGTLDIVLTFNNAKIKTFHNNGSGEFTEGEYEYETNYVKDLTLYDFNRDGFKDLMMKSYNQPHTILVNDRLGNLVPTNSEFTINQSRKFSEIDLNGDKLKDILIVSGMDDPFIWINRGDGNYSKKHLGANEEIFTNEKAEIQNLVYVPVKNDGFEAGNFKGWIDKDMFDPFCDLRIVQAGSNDCWGFFTYSPTEGFYALGNGFDGCGPDYISIKQEVKLPPGRNILRFDYRLGYDWLGISRTKNRTFSVIIQLPEQKIAKKEVVFRTDINAASNMDTGNLTGDVELTDFSGQTVVLWFEWFIPECYTGPAQFQLDNIRILNSSGPLFIKIIEPTEGSIVSGSNSVFKVNTDNSPGVTKIEYYINDKLLMSSNNPGNTLYWNTTLYPNGNYTLKAIAFDNLGQTGMDSVNIRIENIDINLNVIRKTENTWLINKDYADITFSVTSGDSNNVSKYSLYRKENNNEYSPLTELAAETNFYSDTTIKNGSSYTYQIKALDSNGNIIGTSNEVSI